MYVCMYAYRLVVSQRCFVRACSRVRSRGTTLSWTLCALVVMRGASLCSCGVAGGGPVVSVALYVGAWGLATLAKSGGVGISVLCTTAL